MKAVPRKAVILGCGYTGGRVAELLLDRGWSVTATTRSPARLNALRDRGAEVIAFDALQDAGTDLRVDGSSVLVSIPTLRTKKGLAEEVPRVVATLDGEPDHITYLSTTGVYGSIQEVNETTRPAPETERQRLRVVAEEAVHARGCSTLVLRPGAIYGPLRGIHAAMLTGTFRLPADADRPVSRIHVDDLARITASAMEQRLTGSYPVADTDPATSREVAEVCARLFALEIPSEVHGDVQRAGRCVDGRAVLAALGLELRYANFREGIMGNIETLALLRSRQRR